MIIFIQNQSEYSQKYLQTKVNTKFLRFLRQPNRLIRSDPRMTDKIREKDSLMGISCQAAPQKFESESPVSERRRFQQVQSEELGDILTGLEGAISVEQDVGQTANSPYSCLERVVFPRLIELRWDVDVSSSEHLVGFRREFCGGAKVYKFNLMRDRVVEDVLVLQVSVVDVLQRQVVDYFH